MYVLKYYEHSDPTKNSTCMRANLVIRTFCTSFGNRKLCNNFVDLPLQLPAANIQDIFQISQKGTECMLSYVRHYVLEHQKLN